MTESCPSCGKVFKRPEKAAEHIAEIPALCDQTTRHWRKTHGIERVELQPQEVKARPAPDPTNPWSFWQLALAGEEPSDLFGPHWGFFSLKEWIAPPPPERKKVAVYSPVAIWQDDDDWHALIQRGAWDDHIVGVGPVHELFARCCRDPIAYDDFQKGANHEPR